MINFKDLSLEELQQYMVYIKEKPFTAKQIFKWLHLGATSFSEMTNISKDLRKTLEEAGAICIGKIDKVQVSKEDGTRKYLIEFLDGSKVEAVLMRYRYGNSICISSQAGCKMGCAFCASGKDGLVRNLTSGEMLEQILLVEKELGETVSHIVVMGTGEPFDNLDNLIKFLSNISDPNGKGISRRRITVSTCGIVPAIYQFAKDMPQVNLAISLHHIDDDKRSESMPINKTYNIESLKKAAKDYVETTGRRITFEYTLISGENDSRKDMEGIRKLLKGIICHVNLIPLNPIKESTQRGSSRERAEEIAEFLNSRGIETTVRRELGTDIDGACGQLRLNSIKN